MWSSTLPNPYLHHTSHLTCLLPQRKAHVLDVLPGHFQRRLKPIHLGPLHVRLLTHQAHLALLSHQSCLECCSFQGE